jgi:hypothetical protein
MLKIPISDDRFACFIYEYLPLGFCKNQKNINWKQLTTTIAKIKQASSTSFIPGPLAACTIFKWPISGSEFFR